MSFNDLLHEPLPSNINLDEEIDLFHTLEHGFPLGIITVDDVVIENTHLNIDTNKLKNMQIWIYQDEGTLPHFHLISEEKKFYTAVSLDVPEYFLHGKYKDKLNSVERKALNKFLKSQYKDDIGYITATNWGYLAGTWNSTSNETFKCKVKGMPNYEELPEK